MRDFTLQTLDATHSDRILELVQLLNPHVSAEDLRSRLAENWGFQGYHTLGLFNTEGKIIAISSAWVTTRLYGGKLVELDNVIVDPEYRGGVGSFFLEQLQEWAKAQGCVRMELKTYVTNKRSHKFYFDHGFDIRAFYFVKGLE